ncbi:hypothetical protein K443DRAFT_672872 [Laccaria amethystina LaAM-08-1]|uniref:Uncharacterized protein n=1 Tax=Laccaria amethystina LaAM-08-1 TaxID=1095629 RepID=A0A0C9XST4_9AGAR|nr:hypothetical protein K443DRAFT_672872 [Laccaria amethystina LaAM-08-1]
MSLLTQAGQAQTVEMTAASPYSHIPAYRFTHLTAHLSSHNRESGSPQCLHGACLKFSDLACEEDSKMGTSYVGGTFRSSQAPEIIVDP